MMKRLIALSLAVLMMATVFVACGSEKDGSGSSDSDKGGSKESSVDLKSVMDDINKQFDISESTVQGLKVLETADELDRYYMVSEDDITQFAAERSSSSTDFTEIVLLEAADADKVDPIVTQLNSRLDSQLSTAKSYNPESVEVLEKSEVKTNGNFIYLVINDNVDEINKIIEDAIK